MRIDTTDDEAPPSSVRPSDALIGSVALVAGSLLSVLLYLRAFTQALVPLGPDLFGYIWQTRIVGNAPLSSIEARPGVPILGSALAGLGLTSDGLAPLVLAPVMMLALGFAVAVALRLAFRLPLWTVGVIGSVVTLWGGVLHLAQGHLANLLSLVCIVPALVVLALPREPWRVRVTGAAVMVTASGLAHGGLLAFCAVTAGVWVVLSAPSLLRARRAGRRWWQEPSCSFVIALVIGGAAVGVVILGAMGVTVEGFTNIDDRVTEFGNRLAQIARAIGLWVSALTVLAAVGAVAAWRLSRRSSRALTLLGIAWLSASAVGGLLAVRDPTFPGHRVLGVILPLPALAGMGIVGIALVVSGWKAAATDGRTGFRLARALAAACVVVVLIMLVVSPRLDYLVRRAAGEPRGAPARTIASYVAAVDPQVPVVVFVEPPTRLAALSWRGQQNQVRALAPTASIDRIFFLVGRLGEDGLPERGVAPGWQGDRAFAYAVEQSWSAGGAALAEGAIILAPRAYVRGQAWRRIASDPSRVVIPELAVLRGPLQPPVDLVPTARVPLAQARWQIIACLLALAVMGGGYGAAVAWGRGGSVLDGIALAPALGMVVVVTIGVTVAVLGADPAGASGLTPTAMAVAGGYLLAWRQWRERRTSSDTL
ncbi:MAG: hypothetical protein ACR2L4_04105 [Actinomycetota bacterium]